MYVIEKSALHRPVGTLPSVTTLDGAGPRDDHKVTTLASVFRHDVSLIEQTASR
jgi:hypothetical protein